MNIRDPHWLGHALARHGRPEGHAIDCFGTLTDPTDFIYFKVYPDRFQMAIRRVLTNVAAFDFHFVLRLEEGEVVIERILHRVEGGNRRIRAALGEAYAKTSIGMPFTDLSDDEEAWVTMALETFEHYWMRAQR